MLIMTAQPDPSARFAWSVADLQADASWITTLQDADRADLLKAVRAGATPGKPLLAYRRADFAFGSSLVALRQAFAQAQHGRGISLIRGLPREGVSAEEFELMTWAIGLHFGVARPQDKASRYLNQVRDVGVDYRSPTGRGYSSKAELDFHIDGSDLVALSCYNQAPVGGDSMATSSTAVYHRMRRERPDLMEALMQPYPYSRQGEQPPGELPYRMQPIYGVQGPYVFCNWNRNRLNNALKLPGAPVLTAVQREAIEYLDALVRSDEFMFTMRLQPGELQLLNNHSALHSRTEFQDHPEPERKRTLYRLWLATPDGPQLPEPWSVFFGAIEAGSVRGGIHGDHYDEVCRTFDRTQAADLGMRV
jgi:hypothetical protein